MVSKRGCFFRNARARNTHVEATLNHPFPAQAFGSRPLRSKGDDAAGSGGRGWYHPATYELRCGAEALAVESVS